MKRINSQSIGSLLDSFLQENPSLADKLAETRLINSWETSLGPLALRYTENIYIKNRCLFVKLSSSVLKNELLMCRERLIQNLNKGAGRDVIDQIIFT